MRSSRGKGALPHNPGPLKDPCLGAWGPVKILHDSFLQPLARHTLLEDPGFGGVGSLKGGG